MSGLYVFGGLIIVALVLGIFASHLRGLNQNIGSNVGEKHLKDLGITEDEVKQEN